LQIKNLTLGLGIVLAGTALAQQHGYKIKNGDCDWTVARKFNTTIRDLHLANPSIRNWDELQNGHVLQIPGKFSPILAKNGAAHLVASNHPAGRPFTISGDDNDWIIAHHLGVSMHALHELNPDVDWNKLRPGKKIMVPFGDGKTTTVASKSSHSSKSSSGIKVNRIKSRYAVVNTDGVSIRRKAGSHADRVTTVDTGTRVVVLDRDGAWYKLRFPRGTEGWVRGDYLNASHAPARSHHSSSGGGSRVASHHRTHYKNNGLPEAAVGMDDDTRQNPIIKSAVAMRGTRYSYGSSSRSATDCSGFTWQVYSKQGVHLPRTSREQSHVGQPVASGHLKAGDLVFFSTRGSRGVGHVGIYVGNDKFIHASSGGGKVQYNSLHDPYYQNHYKGARRPVEKGSSSKKSESHKTTVAAKPAATQDTNPTPIGD